MRFAKVSGDANTYYIGTTKFMAHKVPEGLWVLARFDAANDIETGNRAFYTRKEVGEHYLKNARNLNKCFAEIPRKGRPNKTHGEILAEELKNL